MSSRRGQSGGFFRRAWHPKPGTARRMSTKRPYLLGPFQLADVALGPASYDTETKYRLGCSERRVRSIVENPVPSPR